MKVMVSCAVRSELYHLSFSHFFPGVVKEAVNVMTSCVGGSELYYLSFAHCLPGVVKSHGVLHLSR